MREHLLSWQWSLYPDNHKDRGNLAIHLLTAPLVPLGTLVLLSAPWIGWAALSGPVAMLIAVVAQGRGHKREKVPPVPFNGPLDSVSRLLAEQWITLPRYLLSGGWGRAWRAAAGEAERGPA
jgi:hypothetical protein